MIRRFLATVALASLAACSKAPEPKTDRTKPSAATIPVSLVAAELADRPAIYEATGTVRARTSAVVSAKLAAYVKTVETALGARVSAGQTLVTLDVRDIDSSVRRASSARDEIKSSIPEADGAIAPAKAQADLAQSTLTRMENLFAKKSISSQELDESSARVKAAQAALDMARARRAQIDAKLAQAEEAIRATEIERGFTTITAPFDGVVTTKSVEPGVLATPGAPLFVIEKSDGFRLEALVEEDRLPAVRLGRQVEVVLDGVAEHVRGTVAEIVPSIDPASRAGTVKIDLPAHAALRSGLFGRALLAQGSGKSLVVPTQAVRSRDGIDLVFVVDGGVAHSRLVSVGARDARSADILSGLSAGEKLVSPLPDTLSDGSPIEVRP